MRRPIADYLFALAICLAAAISYRFVVVPWLRPPEVAEVATREDQDFLDSPNLAHLFPAGSWQLDTPKMLQADWGTLLFKTWKQESVHQWRVTPVTIVLSQASSELKAGQAGPVILTAEEGAVVEFEKAPSVMGGRPKITGGQLIGEVRIHNTVTSAGAASLEPSTSRRPAFDPARDTIDLLTRDVRIDNRQIRSAETVELRVGAATLRGRDLTIHLAGGQSLTAPSGSGSPLSVLDSLELIYLDELSVPLPEGPLWQPLNSPPSTLPARLDVECQGRVVFDFPTFTLRLFERARILHRWTHATSLQPQLDSFDCRWLEIRLVDPTLRHSQGEKSAEGPVAQVTSMLRGITARGAPIVANIPSLDAQLEAGEIDVDVTAGLLRVNAADQLARVRYGGIEVAVPGFEYQMDLSAPDQLGAFVCEGAGQIRINLPDSMVKRFSWSKAVKLGRHDLGHQLWMEGKTRAFTSDGGQAGADRLLVVFRAPRIKGLETAPTATQPTSLAAEGLPVRTVSQRASEAGNSAAEEEGLRLEKLWAEGNVFVDTSAMAAQTDVLFVEFEHLPVTSATDALAEESTSGPLLNLPSGPRSRQFIVGPGGAETPVRAPVAQPRPSLAGRRVSAHLTLRGQEMVSRDISVDQDVVLQHELMTEQGPMPLTYRGNKLRLIMGEGDQRAQITGNPARIDLGDGYFSGPLVIVDGTANQVLMRDQGMFQMPTSVMPQGNDSNITWRRAPRCEFRGELVFDGQTVDIGGQVQLSAGMTNRPSGDQWDITANAPRLKLVLDREIAVVDPTSAGRAAVDVVSLIGPNHGVQLVADQRSPDGELMGRHVLVNHQLDLTAATGQLHGSGPGWYRSWVPAKQDGPMRSIAAPGSLLATHLIFNESLEGQVEQRQLVFRGGVRVGVGTVAAWEQQIDATTMSQLTLNQGTVDCEQLRLGLRPGTSSSAGNTSTENGTPPWELQADGGVAFKFLTEKGLIDGLAARAAYDSSNDVFVLDGTPGYDAVVRNVNPLTGVQLGAVRMRQFTLNAETLEVNALINQATVRPPER